MLWYEANRFGRWFTCLSRLVLVVFIRHYPKRKLLFENYLEVIEGEGIEALAIPRSHKDWGLGRPGWQTNGIYLPRYSEFIRKQRQAIDLESPGILH